MEYLKWKNLIILYLKYISVLELESLILRKILEKLTLRGIKKSYSLVVA